MSTKIYNGWRIEGVDMVRLLAKLKEFREAVKKTLRRYLCKETARRSSMVIDMARLLGKKTPVSVSPRRDSLNLDGPTSSQIMFIVRDEIIHDSFDSQTKEMNCLECDVTAFPVRYRGEKFTLLLLYDNSVGDVYTPHFKRIIRPQYYGYWNNTDPDPDVSESEWEKRGRRWDAALDYGAAADHGFTFSCITRYAIPVVGLDETFPFVETVEVRRKKVYDYVLERESTTLAARRLTKRGKTFQISDTWNESRRWLRTPAGKRFRDRLWKQAKALIRRITISDYKAPLGVYAKEDKRD